MKKILSFALLLVMIASICISVTSCDFLGTLKNWGKKAGDNYEKYNAFDYAIIAVPDGTKLKIDLDYWGLNGKNIVVKSTEGKYYFTHIDNCTLVNDPEIETNIPEMKLDIDLKLYKTAIVKFSDGNVVTLNLTSYYAPTDGYYTLCTEDKFTYKVSARNILFIK